ncbi:hypothetical protein P170DRAFT_439732, partial [Aspergillus steynii IBT 23096]
MYIVTTFGNAHWLLSLDTCLSSLATSLATAFASAGGLLRTSRIRLLKEQLAISQESSHIYAEHDSRPLLCSGLLLRL